MTTSTMEVIAPVSTTINKKNMKNLTISNKVKNVLKGLAIVALLVVGYFAGNWTVATVNNKLDQFAIKRVEANNGLKSQFVKENKEIVTQYVVTSQDAQAVAKAAQDAALQTIHDSLKQ